MNQVESPDDSPPHGRLSIKAIPWAVVCLGKRIVRLRGGDPRPLLLLGLLLVLAGDDPRPIENSIQVLTTGSRALEQHPVKDLERPVQAQALEDGAHRRTRPFLRCR